MHSDQRHRIILELLDKNEAISVVEVAACLDVSEMTVRRDLDVLESRGLLKRVHGGAVSIRGRSYEPSYVIRSNLHNEAKTRIGQLAATLIADGDSIALDVGTTTLEVARALTDKRGLTVLTPSIHIAEFLSRFPEVRVIVSGGILRPGEMSLVGGLTERNFAEFFVDKLFLGIGGIDIKAGLTEYNLEDAQVKRTMIGIAKEVIVVADASKMGQVAFAAVAPLNVVNKIVTDNEISEAFLIQLQQAGVEVLVA